MSEGGFGSPSLIEEGEWAGWQCWTHDPFESRAGPFYMKRQPDGTMLCAFRARPDQMNSGGFMHGGCLMTFADFAVFAFATDELDGAHAVTMNLSSDFLASVQVGALVEARGEVTRAGGKTVFVRGMITADGEPALSVTAILRRFSKKA